jgi:hypothetical protein
MSKVVKYDYENRGRKDYQGKKMTFVKKKKKNGISFYVKRSTKEEGKI